MAKYKTEKRKANVGERILITEKHGFTMVDMTVGNIYEVVNGGGEYYEEVIDDKGDQASAIDGYYEVIVEVKPTKSERISLLESQVSELQAEVQALKFSKQSADAGATIRETLDKLAKEKPTPNEQRKAVIERAKAFVTETLAKKASKSHDGAIVVGAYYAMPKFFVNAEKRVVTFVAVSPKYKHKRAKAIAKCAPDDVFNADIGKAIALGRALGLDVSEFENAVKPTEVVVGMVVYDDDKTAGSAGNVIVEEVRPPGYCNANDGYTYADGWAWLKKAVIIEDTEAQY